MLPDLEPGVPVSDGFIPLNVPYISGNEWKYVKETLDQGWVSSVGAYVERFEREFAAYVGARYAIAATSGTAALHIALLVAGIQPDDEVLVSDLTFVAPANAVRYVGAWPVFMDADPTYWQMDAQKVADFLGKECVWQGGELRNKTTGRRVSALIPVHILGNAADINPLMDLARQYDLKVVADTTEGLGTRFHDHAVSHYSDVACYSFNGNKIITTGNGGMIVTDNEAWAHKARYLTTQAKDDPIEYRHEEIGYNYRLANVLAAIGCAQLEQIDEFIGKKRQTAAAYHKALENVPGITLMQEAPDAFCTFWQYTVLVDEAQFGMSSRTLMEQLQEHQIQTRPLWMPLHSLTPHRQSPVYRIEVANMIYRDALALPCSVGITEDEQARVIRAVLALQTANRTVTQ